MELSAVGTINGDDIKILMNNGVVNINLRGAHSTCAGLLNGNTDFTIDNISFLAAAIGANAVPFGAKTKASFINADTSVEMNFGEQHRIYRQQNQLFQSRHRDRSEMLRIR